MSSSSSAGNAPSLILSWNIIGGPYLHILFSIFRSLVLDLRYFGAVEAGYTLKMAGEVNGVLVETLTVQELMELVEMSQQMAMKLVVRECGCF